MESIKMTMAQLKAELDKQNIPYNKTALKTDLVDLYMSSAVEPTTTETLNPEHLVLDLEANIRATKLAQADFLQQAYPGRALHKRMRERI